VSAGLEQCFLDKYPALSINLYPYFVYGLSSSYKTVAVLVTAAAMVLIIILIIAIKVENKTNVAINQS